MPLRTFAVLLALVVVALIRTETTLSAGTDSPSFLYTVAKHYEPLAWLRGDDRFLRHGNIARACGDDSDRTLAVDGRVAPQYDGSCQLAELGFAQLLFDGGELLASGPCG